MRSMASEIKLFMTSSPMGAYRSTEAPSFKGINPANGMVEELKSYWREDSRCLLISAFPDAFGLNDGMRADFERIFRETGLSVKCMNCADVVYAQPEMPGEALDPSYQKFIRGLGLTDVNVLPHYQAVKDDRVDGLRLMEEITYPDSAGRTFYAIVDGSYVLQTKDRKEIHGEAYRIANGAIRKICGAGEMRRINSGNTD